MAKCESLLTRSHNQVIRTQGPTSQQARCLLIHWRGTTPPTLATQTCPPQVLGLPFSYLSSMNSFSDFSFFQVLNPQDKNRRRTCTGPPFNLLGTNALKLPPNSYRSEVTNNRIAPKIQTFCSTPCSFCDLLLLRLKDDLNYLEMWTFFRETEDGGF